MERTQVLFRSGFFDLPVRNVDVGGRAVDLSVRPADIGAGVGASIRAGTGVGTGVGKRGRAQEHATVGVQEEFFRSIPVVVCSHNLPGKYS